MTVAQFAAPSGEMGLFPPGSMLMMTFESNNPPAGWFACDGRVLSVESFPGLFRAIGSRYNTGGESAGQFRIPDLTSTTRHMKGAPSVSLPAAAATGGNNTHTHNWTTSVNFGLSANGSHAHSIANYINANYADPYGSHGHGNGATGTGTSTSNHNKGTGTNSVAIATHSHTVNSNINAANHGHNHNHNLSNLTINANSNHESVHYVSAQNNACSASADHALAEFVSTMVIKA